MTTPSQRVGMSRAAWDALPLEIKREANGQRYVVAPDGEGTPVEVEFRDDRLTAADVAALEARLRAWLA